ncbi:hypothetical protein L596_015846 [Steinernema carpocapsae]|uniref:Uncharacterized protein n=1 Tax=Steinernema carpocapsae TaxID=34508 RepID=A0A4U5NH59_STECR|nr:hypothetical protein L596_015846 [Steinernema carpocapsae]
MKVPVNQLIDQMEEMYRLNTFTGTTETIFMLVERMADYRQDESIRKLIEYRTNLIDPIHPDWIQQAKDLIMRYLSPSRNSPATQSKAIWVLRQIYENYRIRYETSIVQLLVIPILSDLPHVKDTKLQYEMLCVLSDVSKTVSLWMEMKKDMFYNVVTIIDQFITDQAREADNDNLEVAVVNLCECMAERWISLGMQQFANLLDVFIRHLRLQYELSCEEPGSEVRFRIFSALLSISIVPNIGSLVFRNIRAEDAPLVNTNIICTGDEHATAEFRWTDICEITVLGLKQEKWWPVLSNILDHLARILEFRALVYSSPESLMAEFFTAVVDVLRRFEDGEIESVEPLNKEEIAKHLCPVLSRLLNYWTDSKRKLLCEHIVRLVSSQAIEALMACDICIHMCAKFLDPLASELMGYLASFEPRASTAIPLMELLADASMVPEFVNSFDSEDFKRVVDVLAPYTNVNKFNAYIIAGVHRIMLRWFTRAPPKHIAEFGRYIVENFDSVKISQQNDLLTSDNDPLSRQESGDGRQIFNFNESDPHCYDSSNALTLEAICGTSSGIGRSMESIATNEDRGLRMTTAVDQRMSIAKDAKTVLDSFVHHWLRKHQMGGCAENDDSYYDRMWG